MSEPALSNLTVYLMREDVQDLADAIDVSSDSNWKLHKRTLGTAKALLAHKKSKGKPNWVQALIHILNSDASEFASVTQSGLISIFVANRVFVITFGHGWHRIRKDKIERGFGLKVVMNAVQVGGIKGVGSVNESLTVSTQKRSAMPTTIQALGLDLLKESITALTGKPEDSTLGNRLTGMDALHLIGVFKLSELSDILERIFSEYQSAAYERKFPFVNKLEAVNNAPLIGELDKVLSAALASADDALDIGLLDPTVEDNSESFSLKFDGAEEKHLKELTIGDVFEYISENALDAAACIKLKIDSQSDGSVFRTMNIKECLSLETSLRGETYVLHMGTWNRVTDRNYQEINTLVDAIPSGSLLLPDFDRSIDTDNGKLSEEKFNKRAATSLGCLCMDREFIYVEGDRIEHCDLLYSPYHWISVKRGTRSATLSHFFRQGINPAILFKSSADYRTKLNELLAKLGSSHRATDPNATIRISYAVITHKSGSWSKIFPFHAKLSLVDLINRLNELDVGYEFQRVQEIEASAKLQPRAKGSLPKAATDQSE